MIYAEAKLLAALGRGSPRFLTAERRLAAASGFQLQHIIFARMEDGSFQIAEATSEYHASNLKAVSALPAGLMFVAIDPSDRPEWQEFQVAAKQSGWSAISVPVLDLTSRNFWKEVAIIAQRHMYDARSQSASLAAALSVIRNEHQQTRLILSQAQDLLWQLRSQSPRVSFASHPGLSSTSSQMMQLNFDGRKLIQPLVVAPNTVIGFDLYIARETGGESFTYVSLVASEDQAVLGEWVLNNSLIEPGWLHFPLTQSLDDRYSSAEIIIISESPSGDGPAFSFATERYANSLQLRHEDGSSGLGCVLAMRIWSAFPGSRNETAFGAWSASHINDVVEYRLPAKVLEQARPLQDYDSAFPCVALRNQNEILVHPLPGREVTAVLEFAIPKGAIRIECEVSIQDSAVSDVEFLLAVDQNLSLCSPIESSNINSGWVRVRTRRIRERLALQLDSPLESNAHLFLSSRAHDDGSVDFAQAIFSTLEVAVALKTALRSEKKSDLVSSRADSNRFSGSERANAIIEGIIDSAPNVMNIEGGMLREARRTTNRQLPYPVIEAVSSQKLLVHPIRNQLCAAMIMMPTPMLISSITAHVSINPAFAGVVEFNVVVGHVWTHDRDFDEKTLSELSAVGSWVAVNSENSESSKTWELRNLNAAEALYLITRVPDSGSVDFGSSYFDNIQVGWVD